MDIFERQYTNIIQLDDTEPLTCIIENAHQIDKHTEYSMKVQRGATKSNSWYVSHRYSDFITLDAALRVSNVPLPLPPKKFIGNMKLDFIAERQVSLQAYLDEIMKNNLLASSLPVKMFLDPKNYSKNMAEQALQDASMALLEEREYELKAHVPSIGWRLRKHYYLINDVPCGFTYLMSWITYGPDKILSKKDLQAVFKSLMDMECKYISVMMLMHSLEVGACVIRGAYEGGTVKDILYGSHYSDPYLAKYAAPKQRIPFPTMDVSRYAYHLLLALKYLHSVGLPYGHLHVGNIAIYDNLIQLLDIENSLLGLPSFYRHFIVNHKKINTMEAIDVYSFGHTVYEMAFAQALTTSTCDSYPEGASPSLVSFLETILSTQSCKRGMPTIDFLLKHSFFQEVSFFIEDTSHMYKIIFPSSIKVELTKVASCIETRLRADQKVVRSERRQARIQEILSSEEEIRKIKKKKVCKLSMNGDSHSHNGLLSLDTTGLNRSSASVLSSSSSSSDATPLQMDHSQSVGPTSQSHSEESGRTALLDSICSFNKNKLKRVQQ